MSEDAYNNFTCNEFVYLEKNYILIKDEADNYFSCIKDSEKNTLTLLRVYGYSPQIVIPEIITDISDYCFSASNRLGNLNAEIKKFLPQSIFELAGDKLEVLTLTGQANSIGKYCFYNCTSFHTLIINNHITNIGSDAFMNCRKLKKIFIIGNITEPSCLKSILRFITWEIEVTFVDKDLYKNNLVLDSSELCMPENSAITSVLFPEYTESYEEIAPAHIFGLSVTGEGFRARQCFSNDIFNFNQYDDIFKLACTKEHSSTLCKMAYNRLVSPISLASDSKEAYLIWLAKNENCLMDILIKQRNLNALGYMLKNKYISMSSIEYGIISAINEGWSEGSAKLVRIKSSYFQENTDSNGFIKKNYDL